MTQPPKDPANAGESDELLENTLDEHAIAYSRATYRFMNNEITEAERNQLFHESDLKAKDAIQANYIPKPPAVQGDDWLDKLLDEYMPVDHRDDDHFTCRYQYYECSYKSNRVDGKTMRRFAEGVYCVSTSYYQSNSKECNHPQEYWKRGKCNCGAFKERKKFKAAIQAHVDEAVREANISQIQNWRDWIAPNKNLAWLVKEMDEAIASLKDAELTDPNGIYRSLTTQSKSKEAEQ